MAVLSPKTRRRTSVSATAPGDEVRRQFVIPLWNVYSFFVTYANLDGWTPSRAASPGDRSRSSTAGSSLNLIDWRAVLTDYLENWRPHYAAQAIEGIHRRSIELVRETLPSPVLEKARMTGTSRRPTRRSTPAFPPSQKILAPFTPFVADEMYNNLVAPMGRQRRLKACT